MSVLDVVEPPLEMAFRRKKAEQIVTGLERQINYHLLKLLGFEAAPETRAHWKSELDEWLSQVAVIRLKPDSKPLPAKLVYEWLFDEPFGGSEVANTSVMLDFLSRRGLVRSDANPSAVAAALAQIHRELALRIARNDPGTDIISAL